MCDWNTATKENNSGEMDLQMDMQEYRSAIAEYVRRAPGNVTQECQAPAACNGPRGENEEEEPDQQMMDIGEQMMQANVGRRGQGVKKLSEIEIERHNALVEDVSSDERYAALEDSSLDDDSIKTSDEETDGAKSDEEIEKDSDSSTDKEWEEGTEPSSEEIKSDADDDQHDTDEELTMVAEVLVDSHDWQEDSAAEWRQAQGEMVAAMSRVAKATQELGGSIAETSGTKPATLLMMDGGCYWPIVGKNALHLCVNFRSCKPEPVMTGSGLIWLDEMADLMMLNAPIKGVLINRRMPMTLLSEGWMTLHCGWTTVRGSFGTIVCDPTGQKDLCYREGAISYMPQSMMCCQHENVSQPTSGEIAG